MNQPITPHKHSEVIHAFADGKVIQFRYGDDDVWHDIIGNVKFSSEYQWRVKPAPEYPKSGLSDNKLVSTYYNGADVPRGHEYTAWRRIANKAIEEFIESGEMMKYFTNPDNGFTNGGTS